MKKLITLLVVTGTMAYAGICGVGKITSYGEGRWGTDDVYFTIDYATEGSEAETLDFGNPMVINKSMLDPERFKGIKAILLSAYMSGDTIYTYSHTGTCKEVDEVVIKK